MLIALVVVLLLAPIQLSASSRASGHPGYDLLGEGYCRQADGEKGLEYHTIFHELKPHTNQTNAEQAREKCLNLCQKYDWCYAATVIFDFDWPSPRCDLITDRPTFEASNGSDQNYEWAVDKMIDGISYQTLCAGGGCRDGDNKAMSWDGGKLHPRSGYFCYKKIVAGHPGYDLLGEGECRQANGERGLEYTTTLYYQAKEKCLNLCQKYDWCYAATVIFNFHCELVTDRPTFEASNGSDQNYEWGVNKLIDGISYQTYCSAGECKDGDNEAMNWDGGKLHPRSGFFCYKKI